MSSRSCVRRCDLSASTEPMLQAGVGRIVWSLELRIPCCDARSMLAKVGSAERWLWRGVARIWTYGCDGCRDDSGKLRGDGWPNAIKQCGWGKRGREYTRGWRRAAMDMSVVASLSRSVGEDPRCVRDEVDQEDIRLVLSRVYDVSPPCVDEVVCVCVSVYNFRLGRTLEIRLYETLLYFDS